MAIVERNECVDCATGAYPCQGEQCPNRHVEYLACDECGIDESETHIYQLDEDTALCERCLTKYYDEVEDDYN